MEERYIAAIEISSSKVIGAIGKTDGHGRLDVVAVHRESGIEAVRHGVIQNLEETSMRISTTLHRLQEHSSVRPRKVSGVFVGLSGRSMRSIKVRTSVSLPEDSEITEDVLDRLRRQALNSDIDSSLEIIDAVPRSYKIGKLETLSPKGVIGNEISAIFDLIVCRPELTRNLTRTVNEKLNLRIEGMIVTALATGALIPTREEKRLGCMLVDMGAETTTVSIYKNGSLRYLATLPLGGRNITRDLTTLNMLEERAEDIKITSAVALPRPTPPTAMKGGVPLTEIDNYVQARAGEIVANIMEQIEYAGLKSGDLPGGIIVIGGASRLNKMEQLLHDESSLKVRRGKLPEYVEVTDAKAHQTELMEVVSILYAGATHSNAVCLEMPVEQGLPSNGEAPEDSEDEYEDEPSRRKVRKQRNTEKVAWWKDKLTNWFKPGEDDSDTLD
ncbi:MAG: cell division protein FtsA [Bacteroides sp.]|nr:cell division protein FtsA [Bacteroides sp.]